MAETIGIRITAKDETQGPLASAQRGLSQLGQTAISVQASLAALGIGVSVAGFVAWAKATADAVDALNDIKDATGSTIENISALEDVAKRSGSSLEVVGTALVKMNQALAGAKPGSDTERAIEALGLRVKDLKALDPALAFQAMAQSLSGFADDANKARLVQELFGKSLKDIAPLLNDTAAAGQLAATVTTEQAEAAEKLNKQFFALQANASAAGRAIVAEFTPTLNTIAQELAGASLASDSLVKTMGSGIRVVFEAVAVAGSDVAFVLKGVGREIGGIVAQFSAMSEAGGPFTQAGRAAWAAVGQAMREDAERARRELDEFQARVLRATKVVGAADTAKPSVGDISGADHAAAAAKKAAEDLARELEKQKKLIAELSGLSGSFYEDWARLGTMFKAGKLDLESLTAAQSELLAKQPAMRAEHEAQKHSLEELAKADLEAARAHDAYITSLETAAQKLRDDVEAQREATARLGLSKEAVAALDAAKLEMLATDKELLAIKALDRNEDTLAYQALMQQAQGYRELAKAQREYASKDAALELERESTKAAEAAQAEWQKAADKIQDSITDALMRGFESGKGFAENLRDTVVNMFKTMVLRPIVEFGVRGGLTALGLGGLSGAANASSAVGSLSNLPSLSQLSGWFTDFGGTVTTGIIRAGEYAYKAGFESVGRSMMQLQEASNFSAVANGLNQVGNGLGYLNAAVAASQGKWGQAAGSAIGTYFGGPLGSLVGGTVGGWVDDAFGGGHEYTTGTGLKVALGSGGTFAQNYQNWRNDGSSGFFGIGASGSSSGTNYSAAGKATTAALNAQAMDLRATYAEYAKVIGGDAQAVMQYYKEFSVELGSDVEANKKAIAAMFGQFADGLAELATASKEYSLEWYTREGESTGAALQRLVTSLSAVNGWLDVFNDSLGNTETVLTRAQQASVLVEKFGGLDAYNSANAAYYQAMYSEQERMQKTAQAMSKVFLELNVAAPQTVAEYNALRNSLDLMTDEGRKAYATLTKMGPQFAQVANYAEAAATKMAAAVQAQVEKELGIASTWATKLAVLQGTATERQLQLQADLASTVNEATKQLILQVYAQEDLKAATEAATAAQQAHAAEVERLGSALEQAKSAAATAQSAVESVRSEATSAYLQSLSEVTAAQAALTKAQQDAQLKLINAQIDAQIDVARAANAAAAEMKTFGQRLHEFVDGATLEPTAEFGKLLAQALAGDKTAMQALPEAANAAIAQAQERASSATAFALDKAAIVGKVAQVAALADRLGAAAVAVPERVSAPEQDPVAAATSKLAAAQAKLTQTLAVANAISAPLTASVTDLIAKFSAAQVENAKALADVAAAQIALDAIKSHTAATATGVGTVASTGNLQLTQLQGIASSTAATVTNLASYATGANQTVSFAANDPIYSVFSNISRTNELLIDSQQLMLHQLLGVAIKEDLTAAGAFNSSFQGTYSIQADSLQVLHNILWQAQVANSKLEAVAVAAAQSKDLQSATVATLVAQYNHAQYISAAGQYVRFARGDGPGDNVFATGGVFTNSVVTRPTSFAMGLMGEAGPEAIMPLANINGSLGVRAVGVDLAPLLAELNALRAEVAALRRENSAENRAAIYHLANTADATGRMQRGGVQVFTDPAEPILTQAAA